VGVLLVVLYLVLWGPLAGSGPGAELPDLTAIEEKLAGVAGEGGQKVAEEAEEMPGPAQVENLVKSAQALLEAKAPPARAGLRDPFTMALAPGTERAEQKLEEKPQPDLRFSLSAILWDEHQPVAAINGRMVRVGDLVGTGITVARIEPTAVTLSFYYWGKQNSVRLTLNPG